MSMKNLARDVESIALALSEEGGYGYYHIDDNLRELAKDVSDMQAENAKLRELVKDYIDAPCTTCDCWQDEFRCWNYDGADCGLVARARELGVDA